MLFRSGYDRLVSESESSAQANAEGLAEFADGDRFVWAPPILDAQRIRASAELPPPKTLVPTESVTTFAWAGRLAPANAVRELIRGFARVHAELPATRLAIVGGGPLAAELKELAAALTLTDSVIFAGYRANPYPSIAAADCVVAAGAGDRGRALALEAGILGVPAVGEGLDSENALATAMLEYLRAPRTDSAEPPIDSRRSGEAIRLFYQAIGADEASRQDAVAATN